MDKTGEIQIDKTQTGESKLGTILGESLVDLTQTRNRQQQDNAPIAVGQKMIGDGFGMTESRAGTFLEKELWSSNLPKKVKPIVTIPAKGDKNGDNEEGTNQ